jgi:uncharacterized protein YprB with RNaseH-like and TPR domain
MADTIQGSISIEKAPGSVVPVDLTQGSFEIVLEPIATEEEAATTGSSRPLPDEYYVTAKEEEGTREVAVSASYYGEAGAAAARYLPTVSTPKAEAEPLRLDKHMVIDIETTGTSPLDSRMIMVTIWMLGEPKSSMVTFADEDEEALTIEVLDYIGTRAPEWLVAYNSTFEMVFLSSRMARYQVASKAFYAAKIYDIMDWCKWGSSKKVGTYQKAGPLEDWAVLLFGEAKPYDVETCLAEYEKGNLKPFYVHNRWDVATEGDIYRIIKYLEQMSEYEEAPPALKEIVGTRRQVIGTVDVQCKVCKQVQVYNCANEEQICFICGAPLSYPKECSK